MDPDRPPGVEEDATPWDATAWDDEDAEPWDGENMPLEEALPHVFGPDVTPEQRKAWFDREIQPALDSLDRGEFVDPAVLWDELTVLIDSYRR